MSLPTHIDAIEIFLGQIDTGLAVLDFDIATVLSVPAFPLEEAARLHALNTWFTKRSHTSEKNKVLFGKLNDETLNLIGTSPLGLMAIARVRNLFSSEDQKKLINVRNKYFQQLQNWPDLAVGDRTFLLCDDSYSKGLPLPLYTEEGSLRDDTYFEIFARHLVESVLAIDSLRGRILQHTSLLTTLLYELIKNTHDHALFTASGKGIDDSIRLVLARFYDLDSLQTHLDELKGTSLEPHIAYVKSLRKKWVSGTRSVTQKKYKGILEFSILDSGPGFVGRKIRREPVESDDIDVEYQAVLACLRAGHSTARNPNRGLGLTDVLRALRQLNGFIRVRTNRISGFRDFNVLRENTENPVESLLHDWKKGYSSKASAFAKIRGAAVSVLVPVEE